MTATQAPALIRRRYRPLASIGRGGDGEVLRALDTLHGRHVALKVRRVGTLDEREALVREASLLLTMRPHPGVSLVREDFFWKSRYYVVLDWIDGKNLASLLEEAEEPGLPVDAVLEYLVQVAAALDHLHAHDPPIVHGDVKPANIVVTDAGHAVLVDFGIARTATHRADRLGTSGYVAPEAAATGASSPAADIFSFAATAFTLLTGTAPEPGVRPAWPTMPSAQIERLERAFDRALAFSPERRPQSAAEFVALLLPANAPTNLPAPTTTFVGRERELAAIKRVLRKTRLLTLTGPGGAGKTRLALELASQVLWAHPDGVWLVELGPVQDPDLIRATVAAAVGLREEPGRPHPTALHDALRSRQSLLVFDNCEHVIDAAAELAESLLRACPQLRILATSREPLAIDGEAIWRTSALAVPGSDAVRLASDLIDFDAVRLFCERAHAADPSFALDEANAVDVASVCQRLDGIPLALEMAAALTKTLPLGAVAASLSSGFPVLVGSRTAHRRQRTLWATIEWSYALLSPSEQEVFSRLSVFSGGFTLDAATAVCGDGELTGRTVDELVGQLVARSLLVVDQRDDIPRFGMLQTVREYAHAKLAAAGETAAAASRHCEWFLALAEQAAPELTGADQGRWLDRLDIERDNLRAAIEWTLADRRGAEPAARFAAALWRFWAMRGYISEGRRWMTQLTSRRGKIDPAVRARAVFGAALFALHDADHALAEVFLEESAALSRSTGDLRGVAQALGSLAVIAAERGDLATGRALLTESLALRRELRDTTGAACALFNLGEIARREGDDDGARRFHEESLAVRRANGQRQGVAASLSQLSRIANARGEPAVASSLAEEALAIARELGEKLVTVWCLRSLGEAARAQHDYGAAAACFAEAIMLASTLGDKSEIADSLQPVALLAVDRGDTEAGARLLGAITALREAAGVRLGPSDQTEIGAGIANVRATLGDELFAAVWREGQAMTVADAIDEAVALASL